MNSSRPMEILQKSLDSQILVEIKGRKKLRGRLRGFDQHLNLLLEDADEITRDAETDTETVAQVNTVIVRGDNVVIVSPPPKSTQKE